MIVLYFDDITRAERSDARGGAGKYHVAGSQRPDFAELGDQPFDAEEHVVGVAVLSELAVDTTAESQVFEIDSRWIIKQKIAHRRALLKSLGGIPRQAVFPGFYLQVAQGQIDAQGNRVDMGVCHRLADAPARLADAHDYFDLVVKQLTVPREMNFFTRSNQAAEWPHENNRRRRHRVAEFANVGDVILADAKDSCHAVAAVHPGFPPGFDYCC